VKVQAAHYHARIWDGIGTALDGRARVLEVGCGPGDDARRLADRGHDVVALDVEAHDAWSLPSPGVTFVEASAERLPFPDAEFDAVMERDALHHVAEPGRALREMRRVLRPDGVAVIVECNRWNPLFYLHMTRLHGHDHFSTSYLRGLLEATFDSVDLRMLETRAYPFVGDGAMPAVRTWERLVERTPGLRRLAAYAVAVCGLDDPDRPTSTEAVFRGGLLPALARRGAHVGFHRRAETGAPPEG
jgi:ubiquinone/menaquinone biosynthesis C-methylase UbiE